MSGRKRVIGATSHVATRFATSWPSRGITLEDTKDGVRWKTNDRVSQVSSLMSQACNCSASALDRNGLATRN